MTDGISFRSEGWWWPDYDKNPERNVAYTIRNANDLYISMGLCKRTRTAVQAGGHAGIWAHKIAQTFERVLTFEPDPDLFECLKKNTESLPNIVPSPAALGDRDGTASYFRGDHAGSGRLYAHPGHDTSEPCLMMRLDSVYLPVLDLLVLDVENTEPSVLRGGAMTIQRHRPVIHIEELPASREEIHAILKRWHYRLVKNVHKDGIWVAQE